MEKEINKIKKEYRSIAPPVFLEKKGVADLWSRVDYEKRPKYIFYSRYLAILLMVLVGIAGFIGVTYAAVPGSILYEVKKITKQAVKHVPIVNFVVPQDSQLSPTPTRVLPTAIPTVEVKEEQYEEQKKVENDDSSKDEEHKEEEKEEKQESEVKGEETHKNEHLEDNKEESKKSTSQDEKKSEHENENKKDSDSENHKED